MLLSRFAPTMTDHLRHELRTPLNQILGYSELLQEEAQETGQERFLPDLQRIAAAARQLISLLDRLPERALVSAVGVPRPEIEVPSTREGAGPETSGTVEPRAAAEASGTLLVVDDVEMNRDMLSRRLSTRGYDVLTAASGEEALETIASRDLDLVLLDVMMPGMNGLEVLQRLRQTRSVAELPVIMATARDRGEDVVEALRLGANDYVTKPLDFPVVLARTETQLALKRAMEEIRRLADGLELRNHFIRQTFGRYLSDEVVEGLLDTPEGLKLGGEKRMVTILMADLRGFSGMAERLEPERVVRILNNYLGAMAEVIARFQGTIDEFIGDAVLALFGAPIQRPDDAQRAAACAVAMQLALREVNAINERAGMPRLDMGISVNTGEVVVGNIGSEKRAKYGVVGREVNLTGRIEGYTVGGQILVSDATLRAAGEVLQVGNSFCFEAKGFKDPVKVHDLLGVGGPYQLSLPSRREKLTKLEREVPVTIAVLDGKHVREAGSEARLLSLSSAEAEIRSSLPLAAFSDVRIRLLSADGSESPGEIYAKVLEAPCGGPGNFVVRFTSSAELLDSVRRQATGAAGAA
jgi:adenylate cyclase